MPLVDQFLDRDVNFRHWLGAMDALEVEDFPWPGNATAPPAPHFINPWMLGPLFIIVITVAIAVLTVLLNKYCKRGNVRAT
jgi:hypothetical protein